VNRIPLILIVSAGLVATGSGQTPRTDVTQWQDGRQAAVAITYDDSTINQFRIALPMMNERGLPGTFFVITAQIPGSRHMPTFVGRPIMDILRESATVPTNKDNVFERTSVLWYLGSIQRLPEAPTGNLNPLRAVQTGNFEAIEAALARLRATGNTYAVGTVPYIPVRSEEAGRPRSEGSGALSWDEFKRAAAQGHEFANHTVSHARLPSLDRANILHEVEKAEDEIRAQLGDKHTFSIEAPYGIDDEHVSGVLVPRVPLTRNWIAPADAEFMDGIMRGNSRDPGASTKPYVQWQRGPVAATTLEQMTGWVDRSLATGAWLVLVLHGIEGIGYEPIPADRVRAYFDYIKAQESRLWVATFQDAGKYIRERMKSTVTTTEVGQAIEVSVTYPLDPKVYDVPLTARTTVPDGWSSVRFRQGASTRTLQVQREAGRSYVMYRIMPNAGPARLEQP
jgi:peptidoglycan/xylan/chitin deacetylase (PgdA/CDA1 family)